MTRFKFAEKWAEEVLAKYTSFTGRECLLPVPIVDIAEVVFGLRCDIVRMPEKYKNLSGVLLPNYDRIVANKNCSPGRLAFTIAHEIAHWVVHCRTGDRFNELNWISTICGRRKNEQEFWANFLAGSLLMPRSLLVTELKNRGTLEKIDKDLLANVYGVTNGAIETRINVIQSGFFPVNVKIDKGLTISKGNTSESYQTSKWHRGNGWKKRFLPWLPSSQHTFSKEDTVLVLGNFELIDVRLVQQIHDIKNRVSNLIIANLDNPQSAILASELIDIDDVLILSTDLSVQQQVDDLEKSLGHQVKMLTLIPAPWLHLSRLSSEYDDPQNEWSDFMEFDFAFPRDTQNGRPLPGDPHKIIRSNKLKYRKAAAKYVRSKQKEGLSVVLATGCFDLLTPAHIRFLKQAKEAGDLLVVGVEDDNRVNLFKGRLRPVNSLSERIEVLSALRCVDLVFVIYGPPSTELKRFYTQLYKTVGPDFLAVSNGDPAIFDREEEIEKAGGQLKIVHPQEIGISTTSILKIIIAQHPEVPQVWHLAQPMLLSDKLKDTDDEYTLMDYEEPGITQLRLPLGS